MLKKTFLSLAFASLLATTAYAQPGNNGGGNGGCGVGQQTNGCGGSIGGNGGAGGAGGNALQGQLQGQAQGQLQAQGQAQGQSQRSTNINGNRNSNRNTVTGMNSNRNVSRSTSSSTSSASSRSYNAGNHQSTTYNEARDRLQAPGLAASFSSVSGNPCEGAPFGIGGTGPGFGGLLQIPRESGNCWNERKAILLNSMGYSNAALAVLAGNDVKTAIDNNPVPVYRTRRAIRVKN